MSAFKEIFIMTGMEEAINSVSKWAIDLWGGNDVLVQGRKGWFLLRVLHMRCFYGFMSLKCFKRTINGCHISKYPDKSFWNCTSWWTRTVFTWTEEMFFHVNVNAAFVLKWVTHRLVFEEELGLCCGSCVQCTRCGYIVFFLYTLHFTLGIKWQPISKWFIKSVNNNIKDP